MRRKTQRLLKRGRQLKDRTRVSGLGRTGPVLTLDKGGSTTTARIRFQIAPWRPTGK